MVSSMSVTSSSATKTISGRAVVTKITSGMVDNWLSYLGGLHRELFHYPVVP